ncbi:MAG TPA: hypothetical protein VFD58_20470 [Blastocatellia bacterium]|nr:hypothetical protein [Blastocatellia bacterium]
MASPTSDEVRESNGRTLHVSYDAARGQDAVELVNEQAQAN